MRRNILFVLAGLGLGLYAGFILANKVYYVRPVQARSVAGAPRPGTAQGPDGPKTDNPEDLELSDEEIKKVIARADKEPNDLDLQRKLAVALYEYARNKQDITYLPDAARLFERVYQHDRNDVGSIIALAAVYLDMGRDGDQRQLEKARKLLLDAAAKRPKDADVLATLGLTYFLARPPEVDSAINNYRKALEANPSHELALESLSFALISTGNLSDAESLINKLQSVNAANASLPSLHAELARKHNSEPGK